MDAGVGDPSVTAFPTTAMLESAIALDHENYMAGRVRQSLIVFASLRYGYLNSIYAMLMKQNKVDSWYEILPCTLLRMNI